MADNTPLAEQSVTNSDFDIVRTISAPEASDELIETKTLPGILIENAQEQPEQTAIRWKRLGVWEEITWEDYLTRVQALASGLQEFGFEDGDVLLTIGYNRPHQLWSWLAAQLLGGVAAPNYSSMLPDTAIEQCKLLSPKVAYAEDQAMVDKLLGISENIPSLELIIYRNEKGMFRYTDTAVPVKSYAELEETGLNKINNGGSDNRPVEDVDRVNADDPALLTPTAGTEGSPKQVLLTHSNIVNAGKSLNEAEDLPEEPNYFSNQPMGWVTGQVFLLSGALLGSWTVNFPEQPQTESENLQEISPEVVLSTPRRLESAVADIKAKVENTTGIKKRVFNKAFQIGQKYSSYISGETENQKPPFGLKMKYLAAYWAALRPIQNKLGLRNAEYIYSSGAPLSDEHMDYFHSLGIPLKQIWGQAETCGLATAHRDGDISKHTVGTPLANTEIGISSDGELLVKSATLSSEYYNQIELTEEQLQSGWLKTGDYGRITDSGHVEYIDRLNDVFELSDGTEIIPTDIETKLKFNPYIKDVVIVGDGEDAVGALVNIRYENVSEWADNQDIQYGGYQDLTQKEPVADLIHDIVAETISELESTTISKFAILFKELEADDGELTRIGNIQRNNVYNKYNEVIEAMYSDSNEVEVDIPINYQDGRQATVNGKMKIIDVTTTQRTAETTGDRNE